MAYHELLQIGSQHNRPIRTFWCDSVADIANLPLNVPAGSICECQIAPTTAGGKSTLKVYMFYNTADDPTTGVWYEI